MQMIRTIVTPELDPNSAHALSIASSIREGAAVAVRRLVRLKRGPREALVLLAGVGVPEREEEDEHARRKSNRGGRT